MRHLIAVHVAADAVEADIGDVMLATGIEAAADFDVQVLHCRVEGQTFFTKPLAQLAREPARRRDSKLARVRARAGGDVDDRCGVGATQADL